MMHRYRSFCRTTATGSTEVRQCHAGFRNTCESPPTGCPWIRSRLSKESLRSWEHPRFLHGLVDTDVHRLRTTSASLRPKHRRMWCEVARDVSSGKSPIGVKTAMPSGDRSGKTSTCFPESLRGDPSSAELLTMQEKMERFKALGGRHDLALYNRILRFIKQAQRVESARVNAQTGMSVPPKGGSRVARTFLSVLAYFLNAPPAIRPSRLRQ